MHLAGTSLGLPQTHSQGEGEAAGGEPQPPTFLLHSCSEALLEPAVPALVSFVFVYHTLPVKPGKKERRKGVRSSKTEPEGRARQSPKLQDMLRAQRLTLRKEPQSVILACGFCFAPNISATPSLDVP